MEVEMGEAWSPLGGADGFVAQARFDYASFMEETQQAPAAAFSDRSDLDAWISDTYDCPTIEPFGTGKNAFRIYGSLQKGGSFEQIWVAAGYRRYRDLFVRTGHGAYGERDLAPVDADHVIARTILCNAPRAWVAICPVYSSSNRGFGRIEKRMLKFDPGDRVKRLTPGAAFKIFNGRMISDRIELDLAMKCHSGRNHSFGRRQKGSAALWAGRDDDCSPQVKISLRRGRSDIRSTERFTGVTDCAGPRLDDSRSASFRSCRAALSIIHSSGGVVILR